MAQEAAIGALAGQDGYKELERARGFEPPTFSLGSCGQGDVSASEKGLTTGGADACTNACTGEAENVHTDCLEELAAMLRELSPAERAELASILGAPES